MEIPLDKKTGERLGNKGARVTETENTTTLNGQQRAALTPAEFAALFGKHQTWGYRRIYAGDVRVIMPSGRLLIPASEVKRLLDTAEIYEGGCE
jgi:hypothetical protein